MFFLTKASTLPQRVSLGVLAVYLDFWARASKARLYGLVPFELALLAILADCCVNFTANIMYYLMCNVKKLAIVVKACTIMFFCRNRQQININFK